MEFTQNSNIVMIGFMVWLLIAPRRGNPQYGQRFLAYLVALLLSLIASSEIIMVKPVAFFFSIGGVLALLYAFITGNIRIAIKK